LRLRHAVIVLPALAAACGGSPTRPPAVIEDPLIACPSDLQFTAHNGQPPDVSFDLPASTKGSSPVSVACAPSSGSPFNTGTTTVACRATDSRGHQANCSFSVIVTPVPRISATTFLALGDSLTEGKATSTILRIPDYPGVPSGHVFNERGSYPEILEAKLTDRYRDQTITMIAYGLGSEKASDGKERLKSHWSEFNPDAVLLLEGLNDLTAPSTTTPQGMQRAIDQVLEALVDDIGFVRSRGAQAFLATLLPVAPSNANISAAIPILNDRIRVLAAAQHIPLVDLNAVVDQNEIGNLHPKPDSKAYEKMADEWLKAIVAKMEVPAGL
jgi:lysophospholipase L1-like esterase